MNKKLANLLISIAALLKESESSRTIVVGQFSLPKELEDALKNDSGAPAKDPESVPAAPAQESSTEHTSDPEQEWEELDHDDECSAIESDWEWRLKEGYRHNTVNGVRPERAWRPVEDRHIGEVPANFSKAEFRRKVG